MRYPASEKAEIIQLVEQSHLPAKRTLDKLGIPRATFYRWHERYREGGPKSLAGQCDQFARSASFGHVVRDSWAYAP
jgi:transposase-like protein